MQKSVNFNTKYELCCLKKKKNRISIFLLFNDPLGGHLGFRGEASGARSATQVILQLNLLNYHKMEENNGIPNNS